MTRRMAIGALGLVLVLSGFVRADSKTIARCGAGFLEEIDGQRVLHVKGTPYEMGYQQGALLKSDVHELVHFLFDIKAREFTNNFKVDMGSFGTIKADAKTIIDTIIRIQKPHIPAWFEEELRGLADGADMPYEDAVRANFIPELFHCSGFALTGKATKDGTLYHGRILDYGVDWKLQDHAIIHVAEPAGKIPFVNVAYAGFLGSVTGMNAQHVAIGEMGGRGLGKWNGVPMTVLVRMALEEASDLDAAIAVFKDHPRTCEYYFVISDGKSGKGVGMAAGHDEFGVIQMGESHPRLPEAVPDAVLLSAGDRYTELVQRVKAGFGQFDADSARHLMDRPVAMKSNLHSVLFEPKSTRFWVANASSSGEPAVTQPYHAYQLSELLELEPDGAAPALPAPPRSSAPTLGAAGAN